MKFPRIIFLPISLILVGLLQGGASQINNTAGYTKIGNPAAVYCQEMGYAYQTLSDDTGAQTGVCLLPDNSQCDAWDFLSGQCGMEYSYCEKNGMQTVTIEGGGAYAQQYAVCVNASGETLGTVEELSSLPDNLSSCGAGSTSEVPAREAPTEVFTSSISPDLLPSSFDWRNNNGNWLTPVKDQGGCGSCWAFSAVGSSEAALKIASGNASYNPNLSEQYLVSDCVTTFWGYQNCCGGWEDEALKYIRDNGIPDEACLAYVDGSGCSCGGGTCDSNCTYRTGTKCSDTTCSDRCTDWSTRLATVDTTGGVAADRTSIKNALIEKGPLSVALYMGGTFDSNQVYKCSSTNQPNHAVVLVGYDDAGQYWVIRNSWGSSWNGDGYFKVGYGQCHIEDYVTYVTAESVNLLPAAFSKLSPSDGTSYLPSKLEVSWSPSVGAESYEVCVDTNDNDTCDEDWISTGADTSYKFKDLDPGSTYYWQPRAVNTTGSTEADSDTWWSFTVALTQPAYAETLTTSKVTFDWEDYPDAVSYKIRLSKYSGFIPLVFKAGTPLSTYAYDQFLTPSSNYYWQVRPLYVNYKGDWSPVYRFKSMDPLSAPLLISPAFKEYVPSPVTLSWDSVVNGVTYKVVIAKDRYFITKIKKLKTDALSADFDLPEGKYFWRVKAFDASGGKGPWSEVGKFFVTSSP